MLTIQHQLNPLHLSVADYKPVVQKLESEDGVAAVVPRTRFFTAIYRNDQTYEGVGLGVDFGREKVVMNSGSMLTSVTAMGIAPAPARESKSGRSAAIMAMFLVKSRTRKLDIANSMGAPNAMAMKMKTTIFKKNTTSPF